MHWETGEEAVWEDLRWVQVSSLLGGVGIALLPCPGAGVQQSLIAGAMWGG